MYNILLVEDDAQIREVIADYFSEKGSESICLFLAKDGIEGFDRLYEREYDLVMLDIMMPGMDGFTLCRELRKRSSAPVIFLTARGGEADILYGYDIGGDDYMVKPFSIAELYAKVQAMLKRASGLVGREELVCGAITLNPATYTVTVKKENDMQLNLPPKQYALLKYLMEHQGVVVSRERLLNCIWGYDYEGGDRVVDNHIKKLRHALGSAGKQIKTVISQGYKIIAM